MADEPSTQGREEVTGTACLNNGCYNNSALQSKGLKLWDAKATRRIAAQYGIHANQLEALSIVYGWQIQKGKIESGCNRQDIIGHSGARAAWSRRINQGINEGIYQGILEMIRSRGGYAIRITQKGHFILDKWVEKLNEITPKL